MNLKTKKKFSTLDNFIGFVAVLAFIILLIENISFFSPYYNLMRKINFLILIIFILDVVSEFIKAPDKKEYFFRNWFNLIVFVPLIQFVHGLDQLTIGIIVRQLVIITMLISRVKRVKDFFSLLHLKPAQVMIFSFLFTIGSGAILLMLPTATTDGRGMTFMNALFTATSATCVTGLIVKDTATYLTLFGQSVVLCLIQLGGLGIMTFSISLALLLGNQIDFNQQAAMQDILDQETLINAKKLTGFIIKMTLLLEACGAAVLFYLWKDRFGAGLHTVYISVFHSVSAFCNAGFSTFSDSLTSFDSDLGTMLTISLLIVTGGLGFPVIRDILKRLRYLYRKDIKRKPRLRVQTKITIYLSLFLIAAGTFVILSFEANHVLAGMPMYKKVLISFFQSVSTRTAGFNSCDIGSLSSASLFFMIILMFIGASPGSTGGGIKTTTFYVLIKSLQNMTSDKSDIEAYKRKLSIAAVNKAMNLFIISIFIICFFVILLLFFENKAFIHIIFEAVSAFGTVGLSTGITSELSNSGKGIITMLMFIGRLGPLTIGYAFLKFNKPAKYFYPEEKIMIG